MEQWDEHDWSARLHALWRRQTRSVNIEAHAAIALFADQPRRLAPFAPPPAATGAAAPSHAARLDGLGGVGAVFVAAFSCVLQFPERRKKEKPGVKD